MIAKTRQRLFRATGGVAAKQMRRCGKAKPLPHCEAAAAEKPESFKRTD
jgi:hypothetical protein